MQKFLAASCLILLCGSLVSADENWPEFRGPRGDGTTDAKGLPLEFGEDQNVTWKTPIHGKGWASPVIWGDQIWTVTATEDGKQMFAICVDKNSGKVLHDLLIFENENPAFCHPTNSYASCTPAIEEGRVYVHFGSYGTACLDTSNGQVLWTRRDLNCDHFRGPASSPILSGGLVFLTFDGFDVQFVVALDKKTGKTVWKQDRSIDYETDNGDRKKAYSTPSIIEVAGQAQLVSPAAMATIAYDPETGKELWQVRHGGMNAAARPLFGEGLVFITAGDGGMSLVAVNPAGSGDITNNNIEWSTGKSIPKRSSQILVDGLLYMVNDSGVASCFDAKTGDAVWQKRLDGAYWASPLYADGKIYFFSQEGDIPVVAASRDFKVLANNKLDAGFNASAAVSGDAMFLRTYTHMYRIEKK